MSHPDLPAPFGAAWAARPQAEYAQLLESGGITRLTIRPGLEPWLVTRYDLVRAVLGDSRMSIDPANTTQEVRQAIAAGRPEERVAMLGRHLLSVDPPDHTRMRRLISRALSAQQMAAMEEPIAEVAERLLDQLAPRDEIDLLADYTVPLAVEVVCRLLGLPEQEFPRFCAWGRAMVRAELQDAEQFDAASGDIGKDFAGLILTRRRHPGDDLVSVLADARNEDRLDDHELLSLVYQLFFAGHESSAHFMANAALALIEDPTTRAAVVDDPARLSEALEELLRLEGSVKVPTWRFATERVTVGDVTILPGEPVLALLAAAGRDPAVNPEPDEFRLDRPDRNHLAFGFGIHHCIGAPLGRVESRIGIHALFCRFPDITLARPVDHLQWRVNLMMRGPCELPVRLRREAPVSL